MASLVKREDREGIYYIQHRVNGKIVRKSTDTRVFQIAKQKLRDFENAQVRGEDLFKPTQTPIADVLTKYVAYIGTFKTDKSIQTEIYYLREAFGPVCDAVTMTSRKRCVEGSHAEAKSVTRRARRTPAIQADCFEHITTVQVADFISGKKAESNLAAKTANHYRQILIRVFNWAIKQGGIQIPGDRNPASRIERYREDALEIRFLTPAQIEEQLAALVDKVQLQAMVAMLIFAGLRREEMLWLTHNDVEFDSAPFGVIHLRRKTFDGVTWQPKGRKERKVPISSRLRPYLDKWRQVRKRNQWFFPSPTGYRWEADNFSADLRAFNTTHKVGFWVEKKVGKRIRSTFELPFGCLHFRHTFGTHLAKKGESLFKIAKLMGNSPEIIERHYAASNVRDLIETVEFPPYPAVQPSLASATSI